MTACSPSSGSLDSTMGGPAIDHQAGLTVPRRSLYFQHAAEKQMEFLQIFDTAGVTRVLPAQGEHSPPASPGAGKQRSVASSGPTAGPHAVAETRLGFLGFRDGRVRTGPLAILRPNPNGSSASGTSVSKSAWEQCVRPGTDPTEDPAGNAPAADPGLRRRESLVHVLLNHHDFVTIR